jgi:hypothetical protein
MLCCVEFFGFICASLLCIALFINITTNHEPTQRHNNTKTNNNSCRLGSVFAMISQARRVAGELAADAGADADVRRRWPYGYAFAHDWVTRLEVAVGAAAGVQYVRFVFPRRALSLCQVPMFYPCFFVIRHTHTHKHSF